MDTRIAEITNVDGAQTVRLPEEFRINSHAVSIRRDGEAVILEPLKPTAWPDGFFEAICIADPKFVRPDQGPVPPARWFD